MRKVSSHLAKSKPRGSAQHKLLAPLPSRRRPRFGDLVVLGERRYRICATAIGPTRGYLVRPLEATDASYDRLLTLGDWSVLTWNIRREQWEAA
jgi:hypothetical protein